MELGDYMSAFGALIVVLGLILFVANIVMRLGLVPGMISHKKNGSKRLKIHEVLQLDTKRKLVLISRDDKELLLLLGGEREIVLEDNIDPPKPIDPDHENKVDPE